MTRKTLKKVVGTVALEKGEKGTWKQTLDANSGLGISNYTGYYYHYQIERQGKTVLVLDPYAKSLAAWNSDLAKQMPLIRSLKLPLSIQRS